MSIIVRMLCALVALCTFAVACGDYPAPTKEAKSRCETLADGRPYELYTVGVGGGHTSWACTITLEDGTLQQVLV